MFTKTIASAWPGHRNVARRPTFLLAVLLLADLARAADKKRPGTLSISTFGDPSGRIGIYSNAEPTGEIDFANPFFQPLGTNGRSCVSCHKPDQGWSITPPKIQALFERTKGLDPLFASVDGTNNPHADRSTLEARRAASSLLLSKALIRIPMPVPPEAEYELVAMNDPYGNSTTTEISVFRRPLPSVNAAGFVEVMWDGRQSPPGRSLHDNLASQTLGATLGHAEASVVPVPEVLAAIAEFQIYLFAAQYSDNVAGRLDRDGAMAGPTSVERALAAFVPGMNDPFGSGFNPNVFALFVPWLNLVVPSDPLDPNFVKIQMRLSIARGEQLFNTRTFQITNVDGINGRDHPSTALITGTCSTWHNTPGLGNHTLARPMNLGTANVAAVNADLPAFTLRRVGSSADCLAGPHPDCKRTTDPEVALLTGRWADIGKFKVPTLRGLAARAPYFHGGSSPTIETVVGFYNFRFAMGLTTLERADLANFLRAL